MARSINKTIKKLTTDIKQKQEAMPSSRTIKPPKPVENKPRLTYVGVIKNNDGKVVANCYLDQLTHTLKNNKGIVQVPTGIGKTGYDTWQANQNIPGRNKNF